METLTVRNSSARNTRARDTVTEPDFGGRGIPQVRRPDFDLTDDIPEFWCAQDPFRTLLLAALSGAFPEGERFFIDTVRNFQDRITDPVLKAAIRGFIGQEAHHAREHHALNEFMERRGYPISQIDRGVAKLMNLYRRRLSPERQLANTVAVEHFTALMAEQFILINDELSHMDPRMAKIWAWHALEELEHKAVAFDVYKTAVDNEWIRISQMMILTVVFTTFTTVDFLRLMRHSGQMSNVRMWARGIYYFWGKPGIFRKMIPAYLKYYRRDFHPEQQDTRALQEYIEKKYLGAT